MCVYLFMHVCINVSTKMFTMADFKIMRMLYITFVVTYI